jgi:hypothetical protein
MPESRKRPGHHEYRKPADIPASQRVKGRTIWALLFAVFGLLVVYFSTDNTAALVGVPLACALLGYAAGKRMEKA